MQVTICVTSQVFQSLFLTYSHSVCSKVNYLLTLWYKFFSHYTLYFLFFSYENQKLQICLDSGFPILENIVISVPSYLPCTCLSYPILFPGYIGTKIRRNCLASASCSSQEDFCFVLFLRLIHVDYLFSFSISISFLPSPYNPSFLFPNCMSLGGY